MDNLLSDPSRWFSWFHKSKNLQNWELLFLNPLKNSKQIKQKQWTVKIFQHGGIN